MKRKERYEGIIEYFRANQPEAETELHYNNPYELLVAVILSAQCTDKRVNMVTPELFKTFPSAEVLATSNFDELFPYIRSISYPNNKTKHLLGMAKMLVTEFENVIPDNVTDLQKLPGVGRKTANVVTSVVFNKAAMAVDTHVFRVSKRLGLVAQNCSTPLAVEKTLVRYIPKEHIAVAHHWLILHGRYVCIARKPKCIECKIQEFCRYFEKNQDKIMI